MRIRTRLTLAAFVPVFLLLVVGGALLYSYHVLSNARHDSDMARQIASSSSDLNGFVYSYVLYHEDRPKQQFLAAYDSTAGLVGSAHFGDGDQQRLLDTIRTDNDATRGSFLELVSSYASAGSNTGNALAQQQQEQLTGQILLGSQEMHSDALRLQTLTSDNLSASQRQIIVAIFLAMLLATVPVTGMLFLMRRSVADSLSGLRRGVEVIGAGDLDHRIGMSGRDELADLGRSFDDMTGRLQAVTVSRDSLEEEIAERKRAEIALRESEERWVTTLASIGDAVMATDVDANITFINSVAAALTGWTQAEAVGKTAAEVFNIINQQTRERIANPVSKVLQEKRTQGLANHTVLIRRDGTELPIDDSAAPIRDAAGTVTGVVLVFRDITERKQAEASRQALAEQRQLALDAAHLGWWHLDPVSGMARWDEGYRKIFGVEGYEQLNDEILQRIIHPDDLPKLWSKVEAALDPADPKSFVAEYRINRPDGVTRWVRAHGLASFDGDGRDRRAISFVGTVEDITEHKRAEEELRTALAAKDDFLSMVSHEMRTPLTGIMGNALLLSEPSFQVDETESREMLRDVAEGAKRLAGTIDNMLALARVQTGRRALIEPLSAQAIVTEIAEQHRLRYGHRKIEVRASDEPLKVLASREYLGHIVSNLLENAEKYTPKEELIAIELRADGNEATVRVVDCGIGLTQEEAEHIFEPFYRSARIAAVSPGMGIGLSVCKRLVEEQGGRMSVESAGEGMGSVFLFTLPAAGESMPPSAESSPPQP